MFSFMRIGNHVHVKSLGVARGGQIPYPGLDKFANAPPPGLRR